MSAQQGRKPPQPAQPLRREDDHAPIVPPPAAAGKRVPRQAIDITKAVSDKVQHSDKLQHFMLDATKHQLFMRWHRGATERQLQKLYTDPLFGRPPREQIEDLLREQVRLRISRKEAA